MGNLRNLGWALLLCFSGCAGSVEPGPHGTSGSPTAPVSSPVAATPQNPNGGPVHVPGTGSLTGQNAAVAPAQTASCGTCVAVDACHIATCTASGTCTQQALAGPCNPAAPTLPLTGCATSDYAAQVTVGGGQSYSLLMDSGSSSLALASAQCANCAGITPTYAEGNSAEPVNTPVTSIFGDGSGFKGVVVNDTVAVASALQNVRLNFVAIQTQTMGRTSGRNFFAPNTCSGRNTNDATQGIFGLGNASIELPMTDNYMDKLKQSDSSLASAFAFQACDQGGRIWFGGYDPKAITAEPVYTPMQVDTGYYEVNVEDLQIGGTPVGVSVPSLGPTMVDTGTSLYVVPTQVFDALDALLEKNSNFVSLFGPGFLAEADCNVPARNLTKAQLNALLPTMSLIMPNVAGGAFQIDLPATESYLTPVTLPTGDQGYCPGVGVNPQSDGSSRAPSMVLGNALMHAHVLIFDRDHKQLGFAPEQGCQ